MAKEIVVKIKWKLLEKIAHYYEFPSAVFLSEKIPSGTRKKDLGKTLDNLREEIKTAVEKALGEI